jgi:hypothetical protein
VASGMLTPRKIGDFKGALTFLQWHAALETASIFVIGRGAQRHDDTLRTSFCRCAF